MSDEDTLKTRQTELISRIYAGALDPSSYQDLLRAWDAHFQTLGAVDESYQHSDFDWTRDLIEHFEQAGAVFEQLEKASDPPIEERLRQAAEIAFVVDAAGRVPHMSPAAARALGCVANTPVAELAFDPDSLAALEELRRGLLAGADPAQDDNAMTLLRFFGVEQGEPTIFLARTVTDRRAAKPYLLVRAANAAWHPGAEAALRSSFALTTAENDLVRNLYLGQTIKEISELSGRSQATLRTQLSSVLAKIGVKSQAGLARAVSGLIHVLNQGDMTPSRSPSGPRNHPSQRQREQVHRVADDIAVHLVESGALSGAPCFFIQTTTWPTLTPAIVDALARAGVWLISPYRSGLGQTTRMPKSFGPEDWAEVYEAVIAALGIKQIMVGGQCSGGVYAMALARRLGARCSGLLLLDTGAPLKNARMINQMPLAPRRLFLGARYFPMALKTPYKLATADFYSGEEGQARGVAYFVDGAPHDAAAVRDKALWAIVRDNFDYCVRNPEQAAQDVSLWARDTSALLDDVRRVCPVRFLHGEENLVHRADNIRRYLGAHDNCSARIVADEAQLLMYRRPEILAEEIAGMAGAGS